MDSSDTADGTEVYQVRHDWDGGVSLSRTIVDAIAAVREIRSVDVVPLEEIVDPDALEHLFEPSRESSRRDGDGYVRFTLDGYEITVTWSGDVTIRREPTDERRGGITSEAAFEAELVRLIRKAEINGVEIEGGWVCRGDSTYPDWGIEIYEVR